ncbi:TonB-dependent receptor domain-containing protein [Escherichia coli]
MNGGSSRPLALTTGVRMDDHETYGEHWSPRAYLVYNATDTVTVKGGWATHQSPFSVAT